MEHRPLDERRWWDERAQTLPRPELRLLQEERLRVAVRRALEGAPVWRSRPGAAGVGPPHVQTPGGLAPLPPPRQDDPCPSAAAHPPLGEHPRVRLPGAVRL